MTQQQLLFADRPAPAPPQPAMPPKASEAERRKADGMARAAETKDSLVAHARGLALAVAKGELPHADGTKRANGLVHMDDVHAAWEVENAGREAIGLPPVPHNLGNAAGGVFALRHMWRFTGQRVKSQRPESHSNELKIWQLIPQKAE